MTGFGRQACGVPIRHSEGFLNEYTLVEDVRRSDVMVHYMPAKAQNKILKVLTYDELQRKYGELVARLNRTEEFRKGWVLHSSLCDLKSDLDWISPNLNQFSTELWTNLPKSDSNPKPNPPN